MFNVIGNMISELRYQSDEMWQESVLKITGGTLLASVCAYGGTYFFTRYSPMMGVTYFGMVALISQVAYRALAELKENVDTSICQHVITVIQLFQVPFFFYLCHGGNDHLSAAVKLEIITATAHFAAIPIFIHLAIVAWNDPTVEHIAAAMGVMLPLASRLQSYAEQFK